MIELASKTKNTTQARLGSVAKAGTTGKKRSLSSKDIAATIRNTQKKSWGSSFHVTYLAAASNEKGADSIVDQNVDVVLADVPNHSCLSQQELQGDVLHDDLDQDSIANDTGDNDFHFGMEYNATVYDGRENSVAAVHLSRLSVSPSLANVAASIAPDLSTLSRNGLTWLLLQMKQWEYRNLWSMKLQLCKKQWCQFRFNHRSKAQLFQDIKKEHCGQIIDWSGKEGSL